MQGSTGDGSHNDAEELAAFEAATMLKARYFRFMDLKQWDDWQELYSASAVMDMRDEASSMARLGLDVGDPEAWLLTSPVSIREGVEAALTGVTSVHHGHMSEMEFIEPGRIRAIWAMEDVIRYPNGRSVAGFNGYGHYYDTYIFEDGQWRIESVSLKRLHLDPIPQQDA